MDLKKHFYTIFKTLNPYNYHELAEQKFWHMIKYYLFIISFSILIMFILFIPYLYYTQDYVNEGASHFEALNISSAFKLKDSFNMLSDPVIRFETAKRNMTNEFVLITPDTISYKSYLMFGSQRDIPLIRGVDVTASERAKTIISLGIFFLLPSLLFWAVIFSIIYFGIIILVTYIIALILAALARINAGPFKILRLCVYSSTIFIMLQLILMPFFRIFILPLAAYWILTLVILFLWRDHPPKGHHQENSEVRSGSKSRDIFDSSDSDSEDVFRPKHKMEKRDDYDVDENGNLRSSGKKHHKPFDDENDGYVEL